MKQVICWLIALCLCLGCAAFAQEETPAGFSGDQTILYQGETYRIRKRLTTFLILGIDRSRPHPPAYRNGGQADFQLLVILDDNRKTVAALEIDRDTMTELTTLGITGHVTGSMRGQIALAHAFGDGGLSSCDLAVSAVENLLLGIRVDKYMAMTLDGIAAFNDALGGVEVKLEDDFSAFDPAMVPGAEIRLRGAQAELFVRQRYDVGDQTNESRLRRQRQYLSKAQEILFGKLKKSPNFITALFEAVEPYTLTNMSRGFLLNTANKIGKYEVLPIARLSGVHHQGKGGFIEFEPDADNLVSTLIEILCEPLPQ